jgi:DNA (cytosine-5)-methyltransferase 1
MFEPKEIKLAMGFPEDYIVLGSRDDQVGQLGNAVTPDVPKWILGRVIKSLEGSR